MTTKLTQKHLLKGTHEFEILDEQVDIRINAPFKKEETLSVMLAVLNPEPVINQSRLEFVSRVNGEALMSLAIAKPNVAEFNRFVNTLKEKATQDYNAFIGMTKVTQPVAPNNNSYDEPPEFKDSSTTEIIKDKEVNLKHLEEAINMIDSYVEYDEIDPLVDALKALQQDPNNQSRLIDVATAFNNLKASQGAVLTYAPYVGAMLSDDPLGP